MRSAILLWLRLMRQKMEPKMRALLIFTPARERFVNLSLETCFQDREKSSLPDTGVHSHGMPTCARLMTSSSISFDLLCPRNFTQPDLQLNSQIPNMPSNWGHWFPSITFTNSSLPLPILQTSANFTASIQGLDCVPNLLPPHLSDATKCCIL